MREAARAFSLPAVEEEGYEADDLIASYARTARAAGEEVLVVSSDKDLMQLVGDGVQMWDPMKQKEIGRDEVVERFGVGPELVRDALALIGDTSDNVPGVPGIGPKTAAQLLQEHGSLEGLLAHADAIKQPKRREALLANAEQARLAYQLVALDASAPLPVPLDGVRRQALDPQRILAFCQENGFRSLAARIEQVAEAAQTQRDERAAATERRWVTVPTSPPSTRSWPARSSWAGSRSTPRPPRSTSPARGWSASRSPSSRARASTCRSPIVDEFGQRAPGPARRRTLWSSGCGRCWPTRRC